MSKSDFSDFFSNFFSDLLSYFLSFFFSKMKSENHVISGYKMDFDVDEKEQA